MAQWRKVIVSGSSAVLNQISASGNIVPTSDNGVDLGSSTLEFKDLYIDGTANIDTLSADALGANLDHGNYNSTNVDIDSGAIDGVTIGGASAGAITGTTIDATTDFTIGGTVITDNTITDDGTLVIASTTATSFSEGNITNVGSIALDSIAADDGSSFTISNNWTNAGNTIADLGTVSAATSITATDLIGTNVDGILGADTARAITGTTIDATTDFTIGDTVVTDGVITDTSGLQLAANLDINGTADISGDLTLSAGGDGALRFSAASSIKILDNSATALVIEEADNAYLTFDTTDSSEQVIFNKNSTFNGTTIADLGTVTTATSITSTDLIGTNVDGILGADTARAITGTTITANTGIVPDANDGAYLGQGGTAFSDLFLAEGGVINWDSGDLSLTQAGDVLTLGGDGSPTLTATLTNALSITANGGIGMTSYNASAAVSNLALDIDGMTDIGAAIASGDLIIVDDGAGGTNRKSTIDRVATLFAGTGLTATSAVIAIDAADTTTTSIINASLGKIGTAADQEYVSFAAANEVNTFVNDTERLSVTATGVDITGVATVSSDLTVGGNLDVNGTLTTIDTANTYIADKFMIVASGSTSNTDGGILVQNHATKGYALGYDAGVDRWAFDADLAHNATDLGPDAYVGVVQFGTAEPDTQTPTPTYGGTTNGIGTIYVDTDDSTIWIYS